MQKEFDSRKSHLQTLTSELNASIGVNEKKYFHVKTIENLIFHFEKINTENDKKWVYETLVEYFRRCSDYVPSIDRNTSKSLFFEYLDKVTDYYHNNLGFSVLMNRVIVYFVYFLILGVCYYFLNFYVVIAIAAVFIFQIIQAFKKYRAKQVYGIFW
jgi:hypothetical protein